MLHKNTSLLAAYPCLTELVLMLIPFFVPYMLFRLAEWHIVLLRSNKATTLLPVHKRNRLNINPIDLCDSYFKVKYADVHNSNVEKFEAGGETLC